MYQPAYNPGEFVYYELQGEPQSGKIQKVTSNAGMPPGYQGIDPGRVHVYEINGVQVLEENIISACYRYLEGSSAPCGGRGTLKSVRPNQIEQLSLCDRHFAEEIERQKQKTSQIPEVDLHGPMWERLWREHDENMRKVGG